LTATISIDGMRLELGELELQRLVDLALDLDRPGVGIDVPERDVGEVIAHEERVVRGDGAVVEDRERGFELRRPLRQADHRALLRVSHQRPLAIVERQRHGIERVRAMRTQTRGQRRHAGALQQLSSIEHRASSEAFSVEPVITRLESKYTRILVAKPVSTFAECAFQKCRIGGVGVN
jgi:hypothetical protein